MIYDIKACKYMQIYLCVWGGKNLGNFYITTWTFRIKIMEAKYKVKKEIKHWIQIETLYFIYVWKIRNQNVFLNVSSTRTQKESVRRGSTVLERENVIHFETQKTQSYFIRARSVSVLKREKTNLHRMELKDTHKRKNIRTWTFSISTQFGILNTNIKTKR